MVAAQVPSLRASALNSVAQLLHTLLLGDHGWTAAQQIVASKLPAAFKSDVLSAFLHCVPSRYHWESPDCRARHVYQSWTKGFDLLFDLESARSLQIPFPVSVLANHIYLNMDNESSRDHYYQLAHSILESRVRSRKPISLTFYQDALQDVEYLHQLTGRGAHLGDLLGRINEAAEEAARDCGQFLEIKMDTVIFETELACTRLDEAVLCQVHYLLARLETVQHLDLSDMVNDDTLARVGASCPILRSLKIKGLNVSIAGLRNLVRLRSSSPPSEVSPGPPEATPTRLCKTMDEIDISRCLDLRCDAVAFLVRSLPNLKSVKFLRRESDPNLFLGDGFVSKLEELDVWTPMTYSNLNNLARSFPVLNKLRLFGSVIGGAPDLINPWADGLPNLTTLAIRLHDSTLIDVILKSKIAQQLVDFSILVRLNTEVPAYGHDRKRPFLHRSMIVKKQQNIIELVTRPGHDSVHDYHHQPVAAGAAQSGAAVQLNLHKICQSLPNLQCLKIDMPANYTKDQVGQTSVVYQRDLDLEPTSDGEQVFLRKSRLEKIAIAGLDQVSLDALKSLLRDSPGLKEVGLRDAGVVLDNASVWLNDMIDEGSLSNVEVFNLNSIDRYDIHGMTVAVLSKLMDACPRLLKIGEVNQWGISMKEAKEVAAQRQWSGTINYTHMQQEVIYDQLS